ncbi:hypothetical protein AKJ16_DCAP03233 [Drosera capensis]
MAQSKTLLLLSFLFAAALLVSAARELAESTQQTHEKAATAEYGHGGGYEHGGRGYGHGGHGPGYGHGGGGPHYPPKSASDEHGRHLVEEAKPVDYGRGGGGYGHGGGGYGHGGGGYGHGGGGGYGHGGGGYGHGGHGGHYPPN